MGECLAPGVSEAGPARRVLRRDPCGGSGGLTVDQRSGQLAGISISARFHWSLAGAVSFIVTDVPLFEVVVF